MLDGYSFSFQIADGSILLKFLGDHTGYQYQKNGDGNNTSIF
jgi:hypothetical protein